MKRIIKTLVGCHLIGLSGLVAGATNAPSTLTIDANQESVEVSDTLYGLFYEDINFAADGGLYAEQVFNRSFEYQNILSQTAYDGLTGWKIDIQDSKKGQVQLDQSNPLNENNSQSLKVTVKESGFKIQNVGHTSNMTNDSAEMSIFKDEKYNLSFYLLNENYSGKLSFHLEDGEGNTISNFVDIKVKSNPDWTKIESLNLTATETVGGKLVIEADGQGTFNLDMVSLMPNNYWGANEENWKYGGLRTDLVEALKDLKPQFLRFPGGCVAEGAYDKDNHYNWKETIGPIEERKENENLWGYMQSYGLGYHEYFQLAEDLGAKPIPVVHAGLLCQVRSGDLPAMLPSTTEFKELTQDILDLIEYANGDTSTEWGAKRAENGHKEPFNLEFIAIGNENWGQQYFNNFKALKDAVEEIYPEITVITTSGTLSDGAGFDYAWDIVHKRYPDTYVDEHYYNSPEWFLENTDRYDSYRRDSAKVFVGEFAAHAEGNATSRPNSLYTALAEGAYLTGIERNSDVVKMISYAPLLARVGSVQWTPDMIWFDSHQVMLTPNYYVYQLFSNYIGNKYLTSDLQSSTGLYHSVTIDEGLKEIYIKVINVGDESTTLDINFEQFETLKNKAEYTVITHEYIDAVNTMENPLNISPQQSILEVNEDAATIEIPHHSAVLLRLGYGDSAFVAGVSPTLEKNIDSSSITHSILVTGSIVVIILISHIVLKVKQDK